MSSLDDLLLPPNEAQLEAIRSSIGEDDDRFKNNLMLFKKWIDCEPHMPKNYDENMLSVFLRGCKHNMEDAKRKLELFFLCRLTIPEFFIDRNLADPVLKNTIENIYVVPLPKLTPQGYRVSCFGVKNPDITLFDMASIMKYVWMYGDIRACKEKMIAGDVYVFDCKNFTAMHAAKFINPLLKKALFVSQEAFPNRIREIHVINAPAYIEKVVAFVKLGLKDKLRERFSVHKGVATLNEFIPEKCLPVEWGGTAESIHDLGDKWMKCLAGESVWLKQQEDVKCSGELPKKLKDRSSSFEEALGIQGSFRRLTID